MNVRAACVIGHREMPQPRLYLAADISACTRAPISWNLPTCVSASLPFSVKCCLWFWETHDSWVPLCSNKTAQFNLSKVFLSYFWYWELTEEVQRAKHMLCAKPHPYSQRLFGLVFFLIVLKMKLRVLLPAWQAFHGWATSLALEI